MGLYAPMLQATVSVSIDFYQGKLLEVGKYVEGLRMCKLLHGKILLVVMEQSLVFPGGSWGQLCIPTTMVPW